MMAAFIVSALALAGSTRASLEDGSNDLCDPGAVMDGGSCMWLGDSCEGCETSCILNKDTSSFVSRTQNMLGRDMSCYSIAELVGDGTSKVRFPRSAFGLLCSKSAASCACSELCRHTVLDTGRCTRPPRA